MEIKERMAFKDEDGNKVEFEVVAKIYLEERNKQYLILAPIEENTNEDDAFVFRIDGEEGSEELNLVEDNVEFEEVKKEYKSLLY